MSGACTSERAVVLAVSLMLVACGGEVPVARPKQTGYGELPKADAGETPDAEGVDPPSELVDAGAPPGGDGGTHDSGVDPAPSRAPASSLSMATIREPRTNEPPVFNVTRPADLTELDGPLPVVVWANGSCARNDAIWSPLFERWASAGFVVLSLSYPADQGLSGLLMLLETTTKSEHAKLIDWVVKQSASGPYAGKLDLARIVVAGNTCGGTTALQLASADARPAAAFVLSGSSTSGGVDANLMRSISVPVGYIVGGSDDIASARATMDFKAMQDGVPAMIVRRYEGDQDEVSTDASILAAEAEIALNWMDLVLFGTHQAYDALTSSSVCGDCTPGDWKLESKHMETLKR